MTAHAIIFIAESETALATFVALCSLKKQRSTQQKYAVHILSIGLSIEQENALKALHEENVQVQVYSVDSQRQDTSLQDVSGILSFQLPDIFWEIDKALFLNPHVLIQGDVGDLCCVDVTGHVAAMLPMEQDSLRHSHVLLLHLAQMRAEKTVAKLMACNVPKGDFVGYGRALSKVLSANAGFLPPKAASCTEPCACILLTTYEHGLWQDYARQVQSSYPALYSAFDGII